MTHDLKALRELEKRLAEAKGPDRILDLEITRHLLPVDFKYQRDKARLVGDPTWIGAEKFTASLDAAVALVERLGFWASFDGYGNWAAVRGRADNKLTEVRAASPAIAICLALVRALISQGEQ